MKKLLICLIILATVGCKSAMQVTSSTASTEKSVSSITMLKDTITVRDSLTVRYVDTDSVRYIYTDRVHYATRTVYRDKNDTVIVRDTFMTETIRPVTVEKKSGRNNRLGMIIVIAGVLILTFLYSRFCDKMTK